MEELLERDYLGKWMDADAITPTMADVKELLTFVTEHPYEFDFTVEDIFTRCKEYYMLDVEKLHDIMLDVAIEHGLE